MPRYPTTEMSTNFITFHPSTLSAAAGARRKSDHNNNLKPSSTTSWFTPLFGWPNTPDYIDSVATDPETTDSDPERKPAIRSKKFVSGGFTDEKAKQLRMMTTGKDAFHDVMYHSAIASRLASDFPTKFES